jgi:predicted nucleotide-binding protein (sugar kinase/HSP70/actin superfamily)
MEKNSGFSWTLPLLLDAAHALVYGDLLMRCLYRVRPYEITPGSANALHEKWQKICIDQLTGKSRLKYRDVCYGIVRDFDNLPIDDTLVKPRVGVVGEILVKYMPLANNRIVELLEREGAEAVVPDMFDFFNYSVFGAQYKHKYLGAKKSADLISKLSVKLIRFIRKPAIKALTESKRFEPPVRIEEIAKMTKPFLSIGNQYGEGWFLAGEMVELITSGVPNIVCIQPFACLPNHVVGKGVIKALKKAHPEANVAAVDYDPGASEVNQLNRIKLMLTTARRAAQKGETRTPAHADSEEKTPVLK